MGIGYSDIKNIRRVESKAHALGFRFTDSAAWCGSQSNLISLRPNDDSLPVYHRDADIFSGNLDDVENFLSGIAWAKSYYVMLKLISDKKITDKEEQCRHDIIIRELKGV